MGELLILLPAPGVLVDGVVHVATLLGIRVPPVVLRVPVGFREIGANGELLFTEGIEHMLEHVASWVILEGMFGNREVCLL